MHSVHSHTSQITVQNEWREAYEVVEQIRRLCRFGNSTGTDLNMFKDMGVLYRTKFQVSERDG